MSEKKKTVDSYNAIGGVSDELTEAMQERANRAQARKKVASAILGLDDMVDGRDSMWDYNPNVGAVLRHAQFNTIAKTSQAMLNYNRKSNDDGFSKNTHNEYFRWTELPASRNVNRALMSICFSRPSEFKYGHASTPEIIHQLRDQGTKESTIRNSLIDGCELEVIEVVGKDGLANVYTYSESGFNSLWDVLFSRFYSKSWRAMIRQYSWLLDTIDGMHSQKIKERNSEVLKHGPTLLEEISRDVELTTRVGDEVVLPHPSVIKLKK